jgi:hypothetical protein
VNEAIISCLYLGMAVAKIIRKIDGSGKIERKKQRYG